MKAFQLCGYSPVLKASRDLEKCLAGVRELSLHTSQHLPHFEEKISKKDA
jgi:hypothetical protein